ncbi:MAG: hypothetical protein EOP54_22535, partial [Sphingobacteriales bacterium]
MMKAGWSLLITLLFFSSLSQAQKIVYSDPEKDDSRRMNFEIAGKVGNNFLIYKSIRNQNWISVLDNDMKMIDRSELDFIPGNDRVINVDIFTYPDFLYFVYQYQRKGIVYCEAARVNGNGKRVGE